MASVNVLKSPHPTPVGRDKSCVDVRSLGRGGGRGGMGIGKKKERKHRKTLSGKMLNREIIKLKRRGEKQKGGLRKFTSDARV